MNGEATPPNHAQLPNPSSTVKKPRRNKPKFSRTLKKGARDQKMSSITSREKDSSVNYPPTAQSNTASRSAAITKAATVSGGAAARKWSVSDYKKELKRAMDKISQLEAKVEHGEKQLQASESKRARLTEAHSYSLQSSRESKKTAKSAEVAALNSSKALEDADGYWQMELQRVRNECKVSKAVQHYLLYSFTKACLKHTHIIHL